MHEQTGGAGFHNFDDMNFDDIFSQFFGKDGEFGDIFANFGEAFGDGDF